MLTILEQKTGLRDAVFTAADDLQSETRDYYWGKVDCCNCGILAQVVLGIDAIKLCNVRLRSREWGSWETIAIGSFSCPMTDLPMISVIRELRSLGMSEEDIVQLEDLSNPSIRFRANLPKNSLRKISDNKKVGLDRGDKSSVIAYFRAWGIMLTEEIAALESEQRSLLAPDLLHDLNSMRADASRPTGSEEVFEDAAA